MEIKKEKSVITTIIGYWFVLNGLMNVAAFIVGSIVAILSKTNNTVIVKEANIFELLFILATIVGNYIIMVPPVTFNPVVFNVASKPNPVGSELDNLILVSWSLLIFFAACA